MYNEKISREQINSIVRERIPESNILVSKYLIAFSGVCFAVWFLFQAGFLVSKGLFVNIALIITPILFVASATFCLLKKGRGIVFQYVFLVLLAVFWMELELMSGYKSKLLLPLLIVLSLRYYNKKFTLFTFFVCVLALLTSVWCSAYLYVETEFLDLNLVYLEVPHNVILSGFIYNNIIDLKPSAAILFSNGLRLTFLPNVIFLSCITVLALRFMKSNLYSILKVEELAAEKANAKTELADMKTKLLLSQIQPHFIYNTLTTIAYFCDEDPQKAEELTNRFSEYLHGNLSSLSDTKEILFSKELCAIKNYLEIEKYRFEDRIRVEYDIQTENFVVPVLSVQPIVENAVKHGICKKKDGGTIIISAIEEESSYTVTVKDDGVGFNQNEVATDGKEHVGIQNVTVRIKNAGGEIEIDSRVNVGTTVVIRFPKERTLC